MSADQPNTGWVRTLSPEPPSLQNNTADADRLTAAAGDAWGIAPPVIDLDLIAVLPERLRKAAFQPRCAVFNDGRQWRLIGVADGPDTLLAGVAVDLGTTRMVVRLVDLSNGMTLAEATIDNPQVVVGPDVLTRIHHGASPAGQAELHDLVVGALNQEIKRLCDASGVSVASVCLMAVAGNTAMTHLFLGLPAGRMIREPYIPAVNRVGSLPARAVGMAAGPGARVYVLPNIGSYFGGDVVAGILFAGLDRRDETALMVDVGTNAEVVLGNRHWMMACAGAAGPALESGVAKMGMAAAPGAIERLRIHSDTGAFDWETIDGASPKGICGSGVIDLAAQLFANGMVDLRGRIVPERCGNRYKLIDGIAHLVIVPAEDAADGEDLTFGQPDLDSLIRSKAAMYTILETLCMTVGMTAEEITRFYVAGTFGVYIDPRSAITIGMLPDLPMAAFKSIGNSSLGGATQVLLDAESIPRVDAIRDNLTYLELNVNQDFMNRFSAAKFLPHTDRGRFPSVPA